MPPSPQALSPRQRVERGVEEGGWGSQRLKKSRPGHGGEGCMGRKLAEQRRGVIPVRGGSGSNPVLFQGVQELDVLLDAVQGDPEGSGVVGVAEERVRRTSTSSSLSMTARTYFCSSWCCIFWT